MGCPWARAAMWAARSGISISEGSSKFWRARSSSGNVGQIAIVVVDMEVDAAQGAGQLGCQRGFA